jgi:hypothetical protein
MKILLFLGGFFCGVIPGYFGIYQSSLGNAKSSPEESAPLSESELRLKSFLEKNQPVNLAVNDLKAGTIRFLSSYDGSVPGVLTGQIKSIEIEMLPGASDAYTGLEGKWVQREAHIFCAVYNGFIMGYQNAKE